MFSNIELGNALSILLGKTHFFGQICTFNIIQVSIVIKAALSCPNLTHSLSFVVFITYIFDHFVPLSASLKIVVSES